MGNKQVKVTKLVQDGETKRERIKAEVKLAELKMADVAVKDAFRHEAFQLKMYQSHQITKFTMAETSKMIEKGVDVFDFNCYLAGMNRFLYNSKHDIDTKYLEDIVRHKVCLATQNLPRASSSTASNELRKQDEERDDDDDDKDNIMSID